VKLPIAAPAQIGHDILNAIHFFRWSQFPLSLFVTRLTAAFPFSFRLSLALFLRPRRVWPASTTFSHGDNYIDPSIMVNWEASPLV